MLDSFKILTFAVFGSLLIAPPARGAEGDEFDPVHHVADGYYLDFEPLGVVELPRIFLVRGAEGNIGIDFFSSTAAALASGRYVAGAGHGAAHGGDEPEGDGGAHVAGHEPRSDLADTPAEAFEVPEAAAEHGNPMQHAEEMIEGATHLQSELVPAGGGDILIDLSISRHLVFAILAALIVLAIFVSLANKYKRGIGRDTAPRGVFQNLFETLVVFVRDEIARPNLGPKYKTYLPYLLTAFFFILTSNLLGLVPWGATATSNLMVTAVLATFTFVITQLGGTRDYWKHIFWPPGVPTAIKPILIPVEIVGIFTKPVALAIRLFANMTAGHLVILSLVGLIFAFSNLFGPAGGYGVSPVSVAFALFIYLLELLVAFIQAYVFTLLSAIFIGMAVEEHHGHEHAHDHEGVYGDQWKQLDADHSGVTPHIMPGTTADQRQDFGSPRPVAVH